MPRGELGTGGFLHDENGKLSMARVLLLYVVVRLDALAVLDAARPALDLPVEWWAVQGGLLIALVAWAGGPRGLQYLGGQVGKVARAVAETVKRAAGRKTPDHEREDEQWTASRSRSS